MHSIYNYYFIAQILMHNLILYILILYIIFQDGDRHSWNHWRFFW